MHRHCTIPPFALVIIGHMKFVQLAFYLLEFFIRRSHRVRVCLFVELIVYV